MSVPPNLGRAHSLHTCGGSAAQGREGEHQASGRREAHHFSMLVSFGLGAGALVCRVQSWEGKGGWLGFDLRWR